MGFIDQLIFGGGPLCRDSDGKDGGLVSTRLQQLERRRWGPGGSCSRNPLDLVEGTKKPSMVHPEIFG